MKSIILAVLVVLVAFAAPPEAQVYAESITACEADMFCSVIDPSTTMWFDPQLKTTEQTLVRTGPGFNYFSYGDLPAGFQSRVIGVSKDNRWLVIPLPLAIAPDGKGWVRKDAVSVENVQTPPEWLNPCQVTNYCNYILTNSPQYVPVLQPAETAPSFGTALFK